MSETKKESSVLHLMHCQEPWFSYIRQGKKRVEGKKNSPNYRTIKRSDRIQFYCGEESFQVVVTDVIRFDSLEEYLQMVTIEKALPGIHSLAEAKAIYHQWTTSVDIEKNGFLGIFVEVLSV